MESRTTGENPRPCDRQHKREDPLHLARRFFAKLEMHKTDGRNGVLILISHMDHRYAIWGDESIPCQSR